MNRLECSPCSDITHTFFEAIHQGDVKKALNFYEPNAKILMESGQIVSGKTAILASLERFISLHPSMEMISEKQIIDTDTVVCCLLWAAERTHPAEKKHLGISVGVWRRQIDGSWRISIDSPWGAAIGNDGLLFKFKPETLA
jgi:ketosteroid isomerase-like protein